MKIIRFIWFLVSFLLFLNTSCLWAITDRETVMENFLRQSEAKVFAYQYINDLHSQINQEKYKSLPASKREIFKGFSGSIKNETTYHISGNEYFSKIRNQLMLIKTGEISDSLNFKITGRAYYDPVYTSTNNYPENVRLDQQSEIELRDTYLDYSSGPWDIRLGKQQLVWGEVILGIVTDIVNARDLRELILPDFNMVRIPQWGINTEYSNRNFHAELFFSPILEFDKLGVTSSDFYQPLPLPSQHTTPRTTVDATKPNNTFENAETGIRLSYLLNGWDTSILYLHSWDRSPVNYRIIDSGVYNFQPVYKRLDSYGLTSAKEINKIVYKGEFILKKGNHFVSIEPEVRDGILRKDTLTYAISADRTFFKKFDFTLQFLQKWIFGYTSALYLEKRVVNGIAFSIRADFLNGRISPEFSYINNLMKPDMLYRPRITFKIKDRWLLRLGADIFRGVNDGIFGKYSKKSRAYSELTSNF